MSEEPELGDWRIQFTAGPVTGRAVFKVAEYVLPKFDVSSHFIETRKCFYRILSSQILIDTHLRRP